MIVARYITGIDVAEYTRWGWRCQFLRVRGDDLHCFLATFRCCGPEIQRANRRDSISVQA